MKEAAGEANLTVVAIILIAVIVAIATPLISSLMKSSVNKACCTDAGGLWKNNNCSDAGSGLYNSSDFTSCTASANANKTT